MRSLGRRGTVDAAEYRRRVWHRHRAAERVLLTAYNTAVRRGDQIVLYAYLGAVAACVAVICVRHLSKWWKHQKSANTPSRCGTCGYIILPGSSVVCPECGSDIREKGIITATTPPAVDITPWLVLGSLVALPAALWLAPRVAHRRPFGWTFSVSRWSYAPTADPSVPHGWIRVVVEGSGHGRFFAKRPEVIVVYDQSNRDRVSPTLDNPFECRKHWSRLASRLLQVQPMTRLLCPPARLSGSEELRLGRNGRASHASAQEKHLRCKLPIDSAH